MQINRSTRNGSALLAYDPMRWFSRIVGKGHFQAHENFSCTCSIDEREKELLVREGNRLFRLGLKHGEIFEQLTMINQTFFIQPLTSNEVLLICASIS